MAGVFACPECGQELGVEGVSPGREVQCEACSTWVEVPFLPRNLAMRRTRRPGRSPWASTGLRAAVGFVVVALLGLVASRVIGGRVRSDRERVLAELVASAERAESSSQYDVALREVEAALAHARTFEREGSGRLGELAGRRDRTSLLEAKARLAAVDALDPDHAVGESLTLAKRAGRDPALAALAGEVGAKLDESRTRRAGADLALAKGAFVAGRDAEAVAFAERLHDRAGALPDAESKRFRAEAQSLIGRAVGRSGVAMPPVAGKFAAGSAEGYAARLDKVRVETLKAHGYLPQPRGSAWAGLWDEKAPFAQTIEVAETQDELYLQSKNRSTLIDGTFELTRRGRVLWKGRAVGRTRAPLPDLPAYLAGHLATADRRDPDAERRLQADALAQFVDQASRSLRGVPTIEAAARMP